MLTVGNPSQGWSDANREAESFMNLLHQWLCRSNRWRATLEERVPWVLADSDLGSNVLELGPGPGLTTDLLRTSMTQLTALELDPKLAHALRSRLKDGKVRVVEDRKSVV